MILPLLHYDIVIYFITLIKFAVIQRLLISINNMNFLNYDNIHYAQTPSHHHSHIKRICLRNLRLILLIYSNRFQRIRPIHKHKRIIPLPQHRRHIISIRLILRMVHHSNGPLSLHFQKFLFFFSSSK